MSLTAPEMVAVLRPAFETLLEHQVVQQETMNAISAVVAQLNASWKESGGQSWAYEIGRSQPIRFDQAFDKNNDIVLPTIIARVEVDPSKPEFPFKSWDLALEIFYVERRVKIAKEARSEMEVTSGLEPCARWHIDLANQTQSGPRIHLQYGGHFRGARMHDETLKEPRWPHYPLDLILMAEAVTANFFPDKWALIRDDRNWCEAVHTAQRLCCEPFITYITSAMGRRSSTILGQTWNDRWV